MKIGVLHGMENSFPPALVQRINSKNVPGIQADAIRIGGIKVGEPCGYDVLIDRISHELEFYRAYLKNAAVTGTVVLNDPFRASNHDQFYSACVAATAGVAVPRTATVPQKEHPPGTTVQSLRNLKFPLDWNEVFDYVGFPALLKRITPGRWKGSRQVQSPEEFFAAYDQSGSSAMMLQQIILPGEHYRCYVVGGKTRVIRYDPARAYGDRYSTDTAIDCPLKTRISRDANTTARALGFDIALAEFVVEHGTPYLVEVAFSAPDADVHAIGDGHFEWLVDAVAELAIERATKGPQAGVSEHELAARA